MSKAPSVQGGAAALSWLSNVQPRSDSAAKEPCAAQSLAPGEADDTPWKLHEWAFDADVMLGARLDVDCDTAEEALMPRRAAKTVALPPAEAEEVAEYAGRGGGESAAEKRRAAGKQRVYQRRPLLCHVPGCGQALEPNGHPSSLRYRICGMHLRAEVVLINGVACRHCQKCSSFQPVTAFSGTKRTCTAQLEMLRARRPTRSKAARVVAAAAAAALGTATMGEPEPEFFAFVDSLLTRSSPLAVEGASSAAAATAVHAAPARDAALWSQGDDTGAAALPSVRSLSLKLGGSAVPGTLPASLAPALGAAWCDDVALRLEAAPRPGCTLLHVDALLPAYASAAPHATQILRHLLAGPAGEWLRMRRVTARMCTGDAALHIPAAAGATLQGGGNSLPMPPAPPRPPRLLPLALLSTETTTLSVPGWAGPPPDCRLWLRLHGQVCALRCDPGVVTLPQLHGAEGAARLWLAQEGTAGGAERTVVLTRDAAIAAEIASLASGSADADGDGDADDITERLLCALGASLRPGCAPLVVAAAAASALRRGWHATSSRLVHTLRATLDAGAADVEAAAAARTLLHAAAASGDVRLARLTLSLSADRALGSPHAPDAHGVTPLHVAAAAGGDGEVAAVLAGSYPAATLAWFTARCHRGTTPADLARAAGGGAARSHDALARRLDSCRLLVAELAAVDDEDDGTRAPAAHNADADGDLALARFMLRTFAPSSATASASVPERALYEDERHRSLRQRALIFPPLAFAGVLRHVRMPAPSAAELAALAPPTPASWPATYVAYHAMLRAPMTLLLVCNLLLLLLVGLPQLRPLYERRGHVFLRIYAAYTFLILPVMAEVHVRRSLGFTLRMPPMPCVFLVACTTVHAAYLPLRSRDGLALLAARWALNIAAAITGLPCWQVSEVPLLGSTAFTVVHFTCAAFLRASDARAWAAWRRGRRARLAEGRLRKQA